MNKTIESSLAELKDLAPVLTALGSRTRQMILMLMRDNKEMDANDIAGHFNLSRTAIVHHLGVLKDSGVIKGNETTEIMRVDWTLITKTLSSAQTLIKPACEVQ